MFTFLPTNTPEKAQLFLRANVAMYICFPFFYAQKVIICYEFHSIRNTNLCSLQKYQLQ